MDCPVCQKYMIVQDFGGVQVDVCEHGCKGIWFDWVELSKLDESDEGFGSALKEALRSPRVNDENRGQLNCPKCGTPMFTHVYEGSKGVNVDECYSCGGFFLDSGELKAIRDTHMSEEEQKAYAEQLLRENAEYQQAVKIQEKEQQRTEAIDKMTRFLRPTYLVKILSDRI